MTTWLVAKNNAESVLAADITDTATSLTVDAGDGDRFPDTFPFRVSIDNEIIEVGGRTGDTLESLTRGVEDTTAAAHGAGAKVELGITAGAITQIQREVLSRNNYMARAYLSAVQPDIINATWTTVNLDAVTYDPGDNFDATNHYYVVPVAGYYLMIGTINFGDVVADKRYLAGIYVGNNRVVTFRAHSSIANYIDSSASDIRHLSSGDHISLKAYTDAGVDTVDIEPIDTYLSIALLQAD